MFVRHIWKLILRSSLLVAALFSYFNDFHLPALRWIVWATLVFDMLYRLIPNKRIALGARKHYDCSYSGSATEIQTNKNLHKGAVLSGLSWFLITALILLTLHLLDMLTPYMALIITLIYSVVDLIFILVFCPFQALFLRNHCCTLCRIYNWDYIMMIAPLITFPSFFSLSLLILSLAVLIRWEIAVKKKPHYFTRETNDNLRCENCDDKLCYLTKHV